MGPLASRVRVLSCVGMAIAVCVWRTPEPIRGQQAIVAGLTPSAWRPVGPVNIPGTIAALSIDPRDARIMLAVSPHGGVWRSVDAAAS